MASRSPPTTSRTRSTPPRDQGWLNHSATTANLDATVIDDVTVKITSSVPDPKLPIMDVYIVPKHIWEKLSPDEVTTYDALDGVGSGPFTLTSGSRPSRGRCRPTPNYWGGAPAIDQVIFRVFTNPDAMVARAREG